MNERIYGYARVSSKKQNPERQKEALVEYGIDERNIIIEECSGKDTNRPAYQTLKNQMLRAGDTLVVKELDRLSRNKADIKTELDYFRKHGIRVKILDMPTTLADYPEGQELILDMVNNILIEVLGSFAQSEREKIKQRQREGIASAKKNNVKFGRPRAEKPDNWDEVMSRVFNGELRPVDAMRAMKLKRGTYYNLIKKYGKGVNV